MDIEHVKVALDALVKDPSLAPVGDKTYCNIGVSRIARLFGVTEFPVDANGYPPLANTMCDIASKSPNFSKADAEEANVAALAGKFALAAHAYTGHGHVAIVYPSPDMYFSPSWKKEVPFVANIGKKNGVFPTSEVFPVAQGEPDYYIYVPKAA